MSALIFDCYGPRHQEYSAEEKQLWVSSTSRALIIRNVEGGPCEAEDLQESKDRLESRESTEAQPVKCQ